ncbi:MAG: hypothetical protein ABEJ85_01715 [Haloarculaceae archaeon]
MARADTGDGDDELREIRLLENPDGQWTARDLRVEVSAQGETRAAALENLEAVVAAVTDTDCSTSLPYRPPAVGRSSR